MIAMTSPTPDLNPSRLTWREKLGYGLGDFGSNLVWGMCITFLLYFYTDVFGISAVAAGTLLLNATTANNEKGPEWGHLHYC